jgi:hypothetical protein
MAFIGPICKKVLLAGAMVDLKPLTMIEDDAMVIKANITLL